jgi:hypothetical protein
MTLILLIITSALCFYMGRKLSQANDTILELRVYIHQRLESQLAQNAKRNDKH